VVSSIPDGSVLVLVDGTDDTRRAARWAAEVAEHQGRVLVLVPALDPAGGGSEGGAGADDAPGSWADTRWALVEQGGDLDVRIGTRTWTAEGSRSDAQVLASLGLAVTGLLATLCGLTRHDGGVLDAVLAVVATGGVTSSVALAGRGLSRLAEARRPAWAAARHGPSPWVWPPS
jgi:nucleotide-binding universal stress UspA family protein